ncbi:unnamed protein product [Arabidopsis halleri]
MGICSPPSWNVPLPNDPSQILQLKSLKIAGASNFRPCHHRHRSVTVGSLAFGRKYVNWLVNCYMGLF